MWWILQILACLAVTIKNLLYKQFGFTFHVFLACLLLIPFLEWAYVKSFKAAPTFFQVWFLGSACLAVMGFCVSLLLGEGVILRHYIGAALALVAGYILIT